MEPNWAELLAKLTQVANMVVTDLAEYKRLKEEMTVMEARYREEVERMKEELASLRNSAACPYGEGVGGVIGSGSATVANINISNVNVATIPNVNVANVGVGTSGDIGADLRENASTRRYSANAGENIATPQRSAGEPLPNVLGPLATSTALRQMNTSPVTILRKLRSSPDTALPLVADDLYFSMRHFRHKSTPDPSGIIVKLYLWLNIIKLDPQLTALWYKITSMQKSYHIYKTSLLGQYRTLASDMRHLDSTSSPASPACGHHKCPVVACEFNMMVEESNRAGTPAGGSGSEPTSRRVSRAGSLTPMGLTPSGNSILSGPSGYSKVKTEESDYISNLNDKAVSILTRIQRLWNEIRNYGRGNSKLSYSQLLFLLDFYLRDDSESLYKPSVMTCEVESLHILRFFRPNLVGLFRQAGDDVCLNIAVFQSGMSDPEVYNQLKQQGIYLSMLALIVEEALDVLRMRRGVSSEVMNEFHSIFPLEAVHHGLGYKQTNVLGQVREFVELMVKNKKGEVWSLMLAVCLLVVLLNRSIAVYKRDGAIPDESSAFTNIFTWTLEMLDLGGHRLELWVDPAQVTFEGAHVSQDRQNDLRLLLCLVWADFMRIVNLIVLSVIPIVKHLHHLDRLLESFLEEIAEAEPSHAHIKYLAQMGESEGSVSATHVGDLITSLHVNYLIARASILVRNGICGRAVRAQVADFQKIVAEILAWASEMALAKLRMTRYFEVRTIFNYLEFYFLFIIFLQCEENDDYDLVSSLIPHLFAKALDVNKFLQGSIIQFSKSVNSQYVQVAIAENVSKVSHLIAGLLIRFVSEPSSSSSSGSDSSPSRLVYSQRSENRMPIYIPVASKDELIAETDRTIRLIENSLSKENAVRAIKIWRFYMTFIRNSHKMNPAAYAKLHAEAFGSGRIVDSCPVLPSSLGMGSSTPSTKMGCPVIHGVMTKDIPAPPLGRCPVDHSVIGAPAPLAHSESRKRQCPFDHEALRNSSLALSTFNESNIRGQNDSTSRSSNMILTLATFNDLQPSSMAVDITNRTPPQVIMAPMPSMVGFLTHTSPIPLSIDTMDWETLPNFNFDLVGEEGLVMQINGGYFDNSSIEAMFQ